MWFYRTQFPSIDAGHSNPIQNDMQTLNLATLKWMQKSCEWNWKGSVSVNKYLWIAEKSPKQQFEANMTMSVVITL
jgi:hypothetical protein